MECAVCCGIMWKGDANMVCIVPTILYKVCVQCVYVCVTFAESVQISSHASINVVNARSFV